MMESFPGGNIAFALWALSGFVIQIGAYLLMIKQIGGEYEFDGFAIFLTIVISPLTAIFGVFNLPIYLFLLWLLTTVK